MTTESQEQRLAVASNPMAGLLQFPLLQAIFGRRARRFGVGMESPSGPLAFKSRSAPHPLSELEKALLISAGTGSAGGTTVCRSGRAVPTSTVTSRSNSRDAPRRRPPESGPRCCFIPTTTAPT